MPFKVYTDLPGKTRKQESDGATGDKYRKRQQEKAREKMRTDILRAVVFFLMFAVILFVVFLLVKGIAMIFNQKEQPPAEAEPKSIGAYVMPAIPVKGAAAFINGKYDFSSPVPQSGAVENSYFDDAVFIGDSRTEGLMMNTGLYNATAYVYKGLMVDTVFTKPVINKDGQKVPVMEALKSTAFSKVYVMFGINETGWISSEIFKEKYGEIIDGIKNINPDAVIYIQAIMPVTNEVSSTHSYVKNSKIEEYNVLLQELASEKQVYYIDTDKAVASADGSLPEDAASDGIHLAKAYCEKWLNYLKSHTVRK